MVAYFGVNLSSLYFWGALFAVLPAGAALGSYFRLRRLKTLLGLRKRWAGPVAKARDFKKIAALQEYLTRSNKPLGMIDRQTWRDLNGEQIYTLLDRTFTAPGQAVLYTILKQPCLGPEPLQKRAGVIKSFQKEDRLREELQLLLLPLEKVNDQDQADLLWKGMPPPSPFAPFYTLLAAVALFSLFTPLFWGKYSVPLIVGLFGLNSWLHYRLNRKYQYLLPAISGLAVLLRTAPKIADLKEPAIAAYCRQLTQAYRQCRSISRKIAMVQPKIVTSELDVLYDYLKIFFLLEARAFYSIMGGFNKQAEHLQTIYRVIGELDALQSIASYREGLPAPGYVEPELALDENGGYAVDDARHPLLPAAVPNSIRITRGGVLVTGSNMSGKSTFLRTVGVNALFAQTIFTCLAASYRGSFFRVVTSISREDDLMEGKSFYFQEAERLLKLIQTAARKDVAIPALCIIDELLSGTNYTERFAASQGILNYLASQNARVLAATHDLDLAERLQGLYCCYHFTDQVGKDGLKFDFKLKKGISTTRNAIKLLQYLHYPEAIVEQAHSVAGQ